MSAGEQELIATGKVAKVISDWQVALNIGESSGVALGDTAILYKTVIVVDPDSGDKLGQVLLQKCRLRINHVQQRLCVGSVTDLVPRRANDTIITPRRTKKLTEGTGESTDEVVVVAVGEDAKVWRDPLENSPW